jgi:hypothetical protein
MSERQSLFPVLSPGMSRQLADEPVGIDGMKLEFDEKVALYPATVEVMQDHASDKRINRGDTVNSR